MESLFGLPAHPLVVHGAVVLVPLTALGVLVIAVSSRARRVLGPVVVGFAVVSLAFCVLAEESGEGLEEQVDETELVEEHAELGEQMPMFAALMLLTSGVLVGADVVARRRTGDDGHPPSWARAAIPALAVVAVLGAGAATAKVIDVGHSGAAATWDEVSGDGEGGGEGGEEHEDEEREGEEREEGLAPEPAAVVAVGVA